MIKKLTQDDIDKLPSTERAVIILQQAGLRYQSQQVEDIEAGKLLGTEIDLEKYFID
jgi:hypothetical protein